jgi:hypothetical protein
MLIFNRGCEELACWWMHFRDIISTHRREQQQHVFENFEELDINSIQDHTK